jgi:hypothetical protein
VARLGTRARLLSTVLGSLLSCALVMSAHAGDPDTTRNPRADVAKQAQELLDNGVAHFKAGDLERARVALERASQLVPDKPNPYRWLGLVEVRLGRCKEALVAFDAFLSRAQLGDPRAVEVVTLRDRCRAELEPKTGTLAIVSTPSGAEVRLRIADERLLGKTPIEAAEVPAGSHVVVVRKPGYVEVSRGVTVADKETVRLDLQLEPVPAAAVRKKRYWIIGAVLGPLAAVGLGVGLGVGLTREGPRTLPAIGVTP